MAIWDKFKEGIDKAGKAAQDVFDEGKTRIDAYRAREQADKAAEALGYAVFRAWENNADLDAEAKERLASALRLRDDEAKKLEKELADAKAGSAAEAAASTTNADEPAAASASASAATPNAAPDAAPDPNAASAAPHAGSGA